LITDLQLYLVFTVDFKLHIFDEHLRHQKEMTLKTRLVNHAQLDEQQNKLITAGVDGVVVFQFDVKRTQPPIVAIKLDPYGKSLSVKVKLLYKHEDSPSWVLKCKNDTSFQMIVSWTVDLVCFHSSSNGKRVHIFKEVGCDRETNQITEVALNWRYKYFIVGSLLGHLHVWKVEAAEEKGHKTKMADEENDHAVRPVHVHQFKGHFRRVTSIVNIPSSADFLSASLDKTIRLWSLQTFA
jgi:WD40 repeat protein